MSFDFEPVNASSRKQLFVNDADDRSDIDENEDEEYEVEAIVY